MSGRDTESLQRGSLRAGIFGFCAHGNFGDDLMAALVGRFLKQKGVEPSVYRLCKPYADGVGLRVVDTLEALVAGSDLIVVAGGVPLISEEPSAPGLLGRGMRAQILGHREEYLRLLELARNREIPVYVLSIGGSSLYPEPPAEPHETPVANLASYVSVREPDDLPILRRTGTPGDYFPDIVWQTSALFPRERPSRRRPRVGIDVYFGNLIRHRALHLPVLLHLITAVRRDVDFVFIDTTNASRRRARALGQPRWGRNAGRYQFCDLHRDLDLIASLDLVISTRLHLGVACMSYGIPFLSVFGEKKTALLMECSGLSRLCFRHRDMGRFLWLMMSKPRLLKLLEGSRPPPVDAAIRDSAGHLRRLGEFLERHRAIDRAS